MLTSVMQNTGNIWLTFSLSEHVVILLSGSSNFNANAGIFTAVRSFIEQSGRFN